MRLDPYDAEAWSHLLGRALFGAQRYQEAASVFNQIPVKRASHHAFLAACHAYRFCEQSLYYKQTSEREHVRQGLIKSGLPN